MDALNAIEKSLGIDYSLSTLDEVHHPILDQNEITLLIKRDDRLHPIISGNKWRKLKYIITHALELGYDQILSMGGAYSNHLHALAYVCHKLEIKTTAFIRGEEHDNPTLQDLKVWGMNCVFIQRSEFRELRSYKPYDSFKNSDNSGYWIPEGGATSKALPGIGEIFQEINCDYDFIATACGTGTTLAGFTQHAPDDKTNIGIAALKNTGFIEAEVYQLTAQAHTNFTVCNDYHFGGFAKTNQQLQSFIEDFSKYTNMPIESVYTGKLFYGLFDLIKQKYFKPGKTLIAYHSGGLQGAR